MPIDLASYFTPRLTRVRSSDNFDVCGQPKGGLRREADAAQQFVETRIRA